MSAFDREQVLSRQAVPLFGHRKRLLEDLPALCMERSRPDRMDRVATFDYILWSFTSWTHLQLDGLGHSVGRLVLEQSAILHFLDRVLFYFVLGLFQSSTTLLFTHFPDMGHDELDIF